MNQTRRHHDRSLLRSLINNNVLGGLLLISTNAMAQFEVTNMAVEYEPTPISVAAEKPRFSWAMQSTLAGQAQKQYRITVQTQQGDIMWDSGNVRSSESVGIAYAGKPLQSATRYTWTVSVTDKKGRVKEQQSWFETALSAPTDSENMWAGAQWIGGDADAMPFFSQYFPVFRIHYNVRSDGPATFYYGANDRRLMDPNMNVIGANAAKDESYVSITTGNGQLTVARIGYGKDIEQTFPLPSADAYDVEIISNTGTTAIVINGDSVAKMELNPAGIGGDFTAFPVVGDIGYGTPTGTTATFSDIQIKNFRSPCHVLSHAEDATVSGERRIFSPKETGTVLLQRPLTLRGKVKQARMYATALGCYDVTIDGQPITDERLAPGMTQYNKTLLYQTYDITPQLTADAAAPDGNTRRIAVQLHEGWWSGALTYTPDNWNYFGDRQAFKALITLLYDDGTTENIITDSSWSYTTEGPVRYSSLFMGEIYDNRIDPTTAATRPAEVVKIADIMTRDSVTDWPAVTDYSRMVYTPQNDRGVCVHDVLDAKSVTEVRPGVFVYDLGQNIAGSARIRLTGMKHGQHITARYAEVLYPDMPRYQEHAGMVMMENMRFAFSQDEYICRSGDNVMQPRGTFHGYRYIELTGLDHALPLSQVQGIVLSSLHDVTCGVETSDATLNRFVENVQWSSLANTISLPTDCPQRNERMGWSGDLSVFAPTMSYMFNADAFMRRHCLALRDVQRDNGEFTDVAPVGGGFGGPLWQSVGIVLPWQMYQQYGDIEAVREHYPAMKRYVEQVLKEYISPTDGHYMARHSWKDLGDWLGMQNDENDNTMLFDCYLVYQLRLLAQMADAINLPDDAQRYREAMQQRIAFINSHYFAADGTTVGTGLGEGFMDWTGRIGSWEKGHVINTQTSYAVPLALHVVADSLRQRVAARLSDVVRHCPSNYAPYSLLTGFVGTPWITTALSESGDVEAAYRMLTNTTYPSWLYSVTQGATSIWERMDSYTTTDGFGPHNHMNSFNHYAFGSVTAWLVQYGAGISRDESSPAFKHFVLQPLPDPTGNLTSVNAYYDSLYGRIESSWQTVNGVTKYHFVVPANTTATLLLPGKKAKELGPGEYNY